MLNPSIDVLSTAKPEIRLIENGDSETVSIRRSVLRHLYESEKRYRSTIDNAVEGIIQTTREGIFLFVNPAFARMLGYDSPADLIKTVTDINRQVYVHQEDRFDFLERLNRDGQARCEYQAWKKDGSTTWLLASSRTVMDEAGRFLYYESIVEDVSERRLKEAQLEKLATSLKRSNVELKNFAHLVAHDISQPLSTVEAYCEALKDNCTSRFDAEANDYLQTIIGTVSRMRAVIKDILEMAQMESNQLVTKPVDLNTVVAEVVRDLKSAIDDAKGEVFCSPLPCLNVDREKIHRLFQNLLSNSLKFRRDDRVEISISCFQHGCEWTFSVRDNGIGFDKRNNERVFEMFSRLTSPKQHSGSGMGLAFCKRIVEAHGGRIWAESTPGSGTTILFTLSAIGKVVSS